MKKLSLYLMNQKGYAALESVLSNFDSNIIEFVVGAKDKNVQDDFFDKIKNLCKKHNITFYTKDEKVVQKSKYLIAIGWRWLINLNSEYKLIVLHDSLLPKYRGFAPLVSALINKEELIGVTALFANKEFDKGDIISQKTIKIDYPIKIQNAIEKISSLYSELLIDIINKIIYSQELEAYSQDEHEANYSLWLDDEDYLIDWNQSSDYIQNFINSVGYPYLGASSYIKGEKVRILEVELESDVNIVNRVPGKVIFTKENCPCIVCGKGIIKITKLIDNKTNKNLLPLESFRIRFKNTL